MSVKYLIFIALVLTSVACTTVPPQRADRADRSERRVAFVRVVNTMPSDSSAVDIFAGDKKLFADVQPGAVIPYREVPRGVTSFRARWTGGDTKPDIAENLELLGDGEYSTIVLRPDNGSSGIAIMAFDDHEWAPSTGKVKIRLVHAIPGMSAIDVYAENKRLLGGVDFKDASRYSEMDPIMGSVVPSNPMIGDLVLKRDDNQQIVATIAKLQLKPNRAYTIVLAGKSDNPKTIVLVDRTEERPKVPIAYPLN
jgi:hypothetical protein